MSIATLAGCASDPVPTEQFKLTEQALEQAKAVGASDDQPEMEVAQAGFAEARASWQATPTRTRAHESRAGRA